MCSKHLRELVPVTWSTWEWSQDHLSLKMGMTAITAIRNDVVKSTSSMLYWNCSSRHPWIQKSRCSLPSRCQARPVHATEGGLGPKDRTSLLHICMQSRLHARDRAWKVLCSSKHAACCTAIRGHANVGRCDKSQTNLWDLLGLSVTHLMLSVIFNY